MIPNLTLGHPVITEKLPNDSNEIQTDQRNYHRRRLCMAKAASGDKHLRPIAELYQEYQGKDPEMIFYYSFLRF